ncbi:hypothetical protein JHY03_68470 (plasmid) [Streptomyces sp. CA-256286]|nr:hypothetical protein JHY03_68470 [Streptomyces sp. CA-256286]
MRPVPRPTVQRQKGSRLYPRPRGLRLALDPAVGQALWRAPNYSPQMQNLYRALAV